MSARARGKQRGKKWRHVMIGTRCSWLHGDARGFRSRGHRVHSSGDYKHRPPENEHAGLRAYHPARSGEAVSFDRAIQVEVLRAFVLKMRSLGHRIIACSVGERHLHGLSELPADYMLVKREVGKCKQRASYVVRDALPGNIWSEGGKFDPVEDLGHLWNTYDYIREKQEAGTVVWSHRDDEDWIARPEVGVVVMMRGRKRRPGSL